MNTTGLVRRVDDLGRVVIPKEVRRMMQIREGDPLEILVNKENGTVTLKKYNTIPDYRELWKSLKVNGSEALQEEMDKMEDNFVNFI